MKVIRDGIHGEDPAAELWQVRSIRKVASKDILHVNYFGTEKRAREHAGWLAEVISIGGEMEPRGRLLSVRKYLLAKDERYGEERPAEVPHSSHVPGVSRPDDSNDVR